MFIEVNSKKVSYRQFGENKKQKGVFLLVHGWGGSSQSMEKIAVLLSKDFKVLTIDLPGFGESDMPDRDWGVAEYAELIKTFMNKLDLKNINYFGHSFGGALGIKLAAEQQELISSLILCSPSFKRTKNSKKDQGSKQNKKSLGVKQKFAQKFPKVMRLYYKVFYPESDSYRFPKLETNFRKIISEDLTDLLQKINQRTLVLWGTEDSQTPIENLEDIKTKMKNVLVREIEGYGHGLPLKSPQTVSELIIDFMENND